MRVIKHTRYRVTDHGYLWKKGDIENISPVKVEPCCDEMRYAFDYNFIGFGEYDAMLNRDANVNLYRCSPYPEGAVWDEIPVKFCPFCGAKVEIEECDAEKAA